MVDIKKLLAKLTKNTETRTLLWTNSVPSQTFTSRDVMLPGVYNTYDYIEITYLSRNDENVDFGAQIVERTPCHAQTVTSLVAYASGWYLRHRARWWNGDGSGIHFDSGFFTSLDNNSTGQNDNVLIPLTIYGVKIGGVIRQLLSKFATLFVREGVAVC